MVSVIRLSRVKNLDIAAFYSSKSCKFIKTTLFSCSKTRIVLESGATADVPFLIWSWLLHSSPRAGAQWGQKGTNEVANSGQRPCNPIKPRVLSERAGACHGGPLKWAVVNLNLWYGSDLLTPKFQFCTDFFFAWDTSQNIKTPPSFFWGSGLTCFITINCLLEEMQALLYLLLTYSTCQYSTLLSSLWNLGFVLWMPCLL